MKGLKANVDTFLYRWCAFYRYSHELKNELVYSVRTNFRILSILAAFLGSQYMFMICRWLSHVVADEPSAAVPLRRLTLHHILCSFAAVNVNIGVDRFVYILL